MHAKILFATLILAATPIFAKERLVVWGLSTQSEWDRGTQVITEIFEKRHGGRGQ